MRVTETFALFFAPLLEALEDITHMQALLGDLGVDVPLTDAHELIFRDILPVLDDLRDLEAVAAAAGADEDDPSDLDKALAAVQVLSGLADVNTSAISGLPGVLAQRATWEQIARELPGHLLLTWLDDVFPVTIAAMALGGAIATIPRGAGKPPRKVIDWAALGALIQNPPEQIATTWNWGGDDFNSDGFLVAMSELLQTLGASPRLITTPQIVLDALGNRAPDGRPIAVDGQLFAGTTPDGSATGLFSLILTALARPGQGGRAGLAVLPMLSGSFTLSKPIDEAETITLSLGATGAAAGGVGLALYPQGPELVTDGGAVSASGTVSISGAPDDGWVIVGSRAGSHLRLDRFALETQVTLAPLGLSVTLDVEDAIALMIKASPSGDGLINSILGETEIEIFGGLSATWSDSGGWSFAGGLGLEIEIPIDRSVGPFTLDSIHLMGAAGSDGLSTGAAISGAFDIGPLFLSFEEIGVVADILPMPDGETGSFGAVDVVPRFKPPSAYAVGLDADPITGGGYLSISENEYRGAMALGFETFGFSAYAILTTQLPDGQSGFSFAGSIFCEFSVPLSFGFFLTGVGGFIGINRTIDTDEMREVLCAGRLDDLLFPADPIASASQILDDMAAIMPPQAGQHIIGPVVRISWGEPKLVDITMGVLLEFGHDFRVVILGGVAVILPDKNKALIQLTLQFMGEIDFAAGTISFDATLEGSRVLTFAIDGDVAIRTGWGRGVTQVASFGGLHPDYPKPSNLPDLARLSISFGGNNPRISFSAYQAVTYNSLQVGARADMYAKGPKVKFVGQVAAEGYVAFDALIYFNPFSFNVNLRGGLSILVDGKVKAGLFFSLTLAGPNTWYINGEVWVKVLGVKVRFAVEHRWGQRETEATFVASAVDLLREAITRSEGFRPVGGGAAIPAVTYRQLAEDDPTIDPLGGLQFMQSAVPLDVTLKKIGEADVSGSKTVDIKIYSGTQELAMSPANGEFLRGHFFAISKSERLSDPVFEDHKAGFSFSDTALVAAGASVTDEYEYEIIEIPMDDSEKHGDAKKPSISLETFDRISRGQLHAKLRGLPATKDLFASDAPITMSKLAFVDAGTVDDIKSNLKGRETLAADLSVAAQSALPLSVQRQDGDGPGTPVAAYIAL